MTFYIYAVLGMFLGYGAAALWGHRWPLLAWILTRERIRNNVIAYALRTPYTHIGTMGNYYMMRFWLFNGYEKGKTPRYPRLPAIRLHIILRPDAAGAKHNHPMTARAILLLNGYDEARDFEMPYGPTELLYKRRAGDTYTLTPADFHRIVSITPEGPAYTLFFIWGNSDEWGFKVGGKVVDRNEYTATR